MRPGGTLNSYQKGSTLLAKATQKKLPDASGRGLGWLSRSLVEHPLLWVFLVALIARLVASAVAYTIFGGSPVLDDETYSRLALDVLTGDSDRWDLFHTQLYNRTATLTVPLTWIYALFGAHQMYGQVFIGLLGAITAAVATRLAMEGLPRRLALVTGLTIALLPSQVLWSSLILKDGPVWLLLVSLALVIAVASRSDHRRLALLGVAAITLLLLLAYLRQHTFVIACCALALTGWVGTKHLRWARGVGAIAIGVSLPWVLGLGPGGSTLVANSAGSVAKLRTLNALGASAFIDREPIEEAEIIRLAQEAGVPPEQIKELATDESIPFDPATCVERLAGRDRLPRATIEEICAARNRVPVATPPPNDDELLEPNIQHLPTGIRVMLLEPTPWYESDSRALGFAQLETVVWYPILLLGLLGLYRLVRATRVGLFAVLAGGGSLLTYALTEGNIGTAYRHRGEFIWVVALAAAFGLQQLQVWRGRSAAAQGPGEEVASREPNGLDRVEPTEPTGSVRGSTTHADRPAN